MPKLTELGLSQDFTGLSTLLLGQAQPAQFQSQNQSGYWWGSKVSDDGNWTALGSVSNNANAEIPRSYAYETDRFYNWYSATAESGTYAMASGNASDSLCPKGWLLPQNDGSKSWYNLLFTSYGLSSNEASSAFMRQSPLSLSFGGSYYWLLGIMGARTYGNFWSSTPNGTSDALNLGLRADYISVRGTGIKANGFSVRCLKE